MKPKTSELNGGRRQGLRHSLQLFLLPVLMVGVWAGCKQEVKVASEAHESRVTTNLSRTSTSEPSPESRALSVRVKATPSSCAVGEKTTITALVFDGFGKPVSGAKVQIAAGGGRFLAGSDEAYDPKARLHGPYSAVGSSDQEGRFVTWWVVNPATAAYVMDIQVTKESWGEARTNRKRR